MEILFLDTFKCIIVLFELYIFIQGYNAYFEKKRINVSFDVFSKVLLFIIICFINIYLDNVAKLFFFSFIIYIVFACLIYSCRVQVFILSLVLWCFGAASEALTFAIIAFISKKNFFDIAISQGSILWVISAIVSKIFMLIFIKIIIKFHSTKINNDTMPLKYWIGIMCIPILSAILLVFSLDIYSETNTRSVRIISGFSILIVFINLIVFHISEEIYRQADSKVENLILKQQLVAQLKHYNQLKINDEKIITIVHDTKNTLFCLEKMLQQKQYDTALVHIKKILGVLLENCNATKYTDNPVIDAFLNEKLIMAKNSGIAVTMRIDKIPELKVNIIDLCLIFGNALDNAIEACNKREIYDVASIDIKVLLSGVNLKIEISNTLFDTISQSNGQLNTNKKNTMMHGYGLKNIRKIIEKYNGNMGVQINENIFVFGAILPNTKVF